MHGLGQCSSRCAPMRTPRCTKFIFGYRVILRCTKFLIKLDSHSGVYDERHENKKCLAYFWLVLSLGCRDFLNFSLVAQITISVKTTDLVHRTILVLFPILFLRHKVSHILWRHNTKQASDRTQQTIWSEVDTMNIKLTWRWLNCDQAGS